MKNEKKVNERILEFKNQVEKENMLFLLDGRKSKTPYSQNSQIQIKRLIEDNLYDEKVGLYYILRLQQLIREECLNKEQKMTYDPLITWFYSYNIIVCKYKSESGGRIRYVFENDLNCIRYKRNELRTIRDFISYSFNLGNKKKWLLKPLEILKWKDLDLINYSNTYTKNEINVIRHFISFPADWDIENLIEKDPKLNFNIKNSKNEEIKNG